MIKTKNNFLFIGGLCSFIISTIHIAAIIIGPKAYTFLDAEELANLALSGSYIPAIATSIIAALFFIFGCYGLSGSGIIKKLPFLSPFLKIIATLYTLRGAFVIIFLFLWMINSPLLKIREIYFSLTSLGIGLIHLIGIYKKN